MINKNELTWRKAYFQYITDVLGDQTEFPISNPNDTVRLFHGTNTLHLNNILFEGLLPRESSKNGNWNDLSPSHPKLVYLTNKLHYFYASASITKYMTDKYENIEDRAWWKTFEAMPCYIELAVPKELLVADEDFFTSNYLKKRIESQKKKGIKYFDMSSITWEECLAQYGTVASIGKIDPKYIVSFTAIGDPEWFWNYVDRPDCQYQKEYLKWVDGKGKGKLTWLDMAKLENKTMAVGTWWMKDLPKNHYIKEFRLHGKNKNIQIFFKPMLTPDLSLGLGVSK